MNNAVSLEWYSNPHMEHWNEVCIWVIEQFGLPGDKYTTELNDKVMTWYFNDQHDQMVMALVWGNDRKFNTVK